jgi:hypothetical protein
MNTREEIDQLSKTAGQVRGATLQTDREYVKRHFGPDALKKVEARLKDWGIPIIYEKIDAMTWYPGGWRPISLLAIREVFGLNDEQIKAMGMEAPKYSFLVKLLMKFFLSLTQTFRNAPVYWRKHWTIGELELGEINEKEKVLVLHLKNHALHPILCKFEEGYFLGISSYVVKAKRIEETQCTFRGAPYHEYKIYWE